MSDFWKFFFEAFLIPAIESVNYISVDKLSRRASSDTQAKSGFKRLKG